MDENNVEEIDVNEPQIQEDSSQKQERDWETEARAQGWNPNYDGEDRVDAREFVLRKPLFDDLKKLRRKTRELEAAIMAQQRVYNEHLEKARERALKELQDEKRRALQSGDVEAVMSIDERIQEVNKPVQAPTSVPKEFIEFVERNPWYESDQHMKRWADAYGLEYKQKHPNATIDEIYKMVETEAREAFPHKFEAKKKNRPPVVESGSGAPASFSKEIKVPHEHRVIAEAMWKQGAWGNIPFKKALAQYAKDYVERFGDFE